MERNKETTTEWNGFPVEEVERKMQKMLAGMEEMQKLYFKGKIVCDKKLFGLLLGAVSAMRKIPGIDRPLPIDALYTSNSEEEKQIFQAHLKDKYNITDYQSFIEGCNKLYNTQETYNQFALYWVGMKPFDFSKLSPEGKLAFDKSEEMARFFSKYVKKHGFYAWDCSEKVIVAKCVYACGIIDEEDFYDLVEGMTDKVLAMYSSWYEYAVSLICGATYFVYQRSGFDGKQAKNMFDLMYNLVEGLFLSGKANLWLRFEWYGAIQQEEK